MQHKHQGKQQYIDRAKTVGMNLPPHDVYAALTKILNARGDYRVVTDVGQHQMWAAQLIDWIKPRTHITSGGAGTMGFSVPAAMGVAIAHPKETIWAICGDGCFQMMNQEMATMMQEGIKNVKIAVINNGYLGMVRQWQELFENKRYSGTPLSGPDFAKLAEAYGWTGITVEHSADVEAALEAAYAIDGPVLIDFRVEREVNVFPMVPAGSSIGEMIMEAPVGVARVRSAEVGFYLRSYVRSAERITTNEESPCCRRHADFDNSYHCAYSLRRYRVNKHTVVALVQDQPGVLNRMVSLFRRRGYNIESLAVGHTESEGVSRLTLVVEAADVEQVVKQLYRLIDVLKVSDVTDDPTVEREMVLVKLHAPSEKRAEIVALMEVFDAKIVDVGTNSLIIEMTGAPGKVQNFIDVIRAFGVKEMMRTGRIAMVRGTRGHPADAHQPRATGTPTSAVVLN